jgi:hypothetical protein
MCFGQTMTKSETTQPSNFTQWAGQNAYGLANSLASQPFSAPLQGTAGFNPMQTQGWGKIADMASAPNANNPFFNQEANAFSAYGSAPQSSVFAPSILGGGTNPFTANLTDYVDPNLRFELDPALANITRQANIAKSGPGGVGAAATAAGAFGDARQGVENANVDEAAMRQAALATGQAYRDAFQNAAALRGTDISNLIGTQASNAQLREQMLNRMLGSGSALQNLAQFQTGQGLNLAQAAIAGGTQQQQNAQQQLSALYNQQLQNLLGPYQYQLPALTAALTAMKGTQPSVTNTYQPNNSLAALLGPLAAAAPSLIGGIGSGLGSVFGSLGSLFGGGAAAGTGAGIMDAARLAAV